MGYVQISDVRVHVTPKNKIMLKYPFKNKNGEFDTMYIPLPQDYELISKNDLEGFMHLQNRVKDFSELEFYSNELSECYVCSNRKQKPIKAEFLLANSEGETKYICLDCALHELNEKSSQEKKRDFDNSFICANCNEVSCDCQDTEKQREYIKAQQDLEDLENKNSVLTISKRNSQKSFPICDTQNCHDILNNVWKD